MKLIHLSILGILMTCIAGAATQEVIVLTLGYDGQNISIEGVVTTQGYFEEQVLQEETDFKLELQDKDGNVLYVRTFGFSSIVEFSVSPEWFDEHGNQVFIPQEDETTTQTYQETELLLPNLEEADRIVIYDSEEIVLKRIQIEDEQFSQIQGSLGKSEEGSRGSWGMHSTSGLIIFALAIILVYYYRRHKKKIEKKIFK